MAGKEPDPIVSPDAQPGQPYDCSNDEDIAGWRKISDSGPADPMTFETHGDWPDGPGPWRQC